MRQEKGGWRAKKQKPSCGSFILGRWYANWIGYIRFEVEGGCTLARCEVCRFGPKKQKVSHWGSVLVISSQSPSQLHVVIQWRCSDGDRGGTVAKLLLSSPSLSLLLWPFLPSSPSSLSWLASPPPMGLVSVSNMWLVTSFRYLTYL